MKVAEEEYTGAFYVASNVAASFKADGFEDGFLGALDEALAGHMSTEGFEEGGTVRVIAVEETALGLFSRYKRVVAMEYRPPIPPASRCASTASTGRRRTATGTTRAASPAAAAGARHARARR